jgi:hypothetical protein
VEIKKGDRVNRHGVSGVVLDVDEVALKAHVHWGTVTAAEGKPGIPVTGWIPLDELERSTEKVWYGTVAEDNRILLYDPDK